MSKQIRLGQVARKLNVGRNTIIEFLHNKGFEIDSNPNTKINEELFSLLESAFQDSAVEKKVASNIKIGIEEKKSFLEKVDNIDKKETDNLKKEEKKEEKKEVSKIKIIKKIDLGDTKNRVASSDQSKKKKRPRKRIIAKKNNDTKKVNQEDQDKKNKEIQNKIKSTLAKLSGTKDSDTKRSKYRKEKRSQHAEAIEEEKIKLEEESKVLKAVSYTHLTLPTNREV